MYKGQQLEYDTKQLFSKLGFEIDISSVQFKVTKEEIKDLVQLNCYRDENTKTIEIDVFGKKKVNNQIYFLLAECKSRIKPINVKQIICFIIKANIIAARSIKNQEFLSNKKPLFKLIIISLKGFPEVDQNQLLIKYWTVGKGRILNRNIEFINLDDLLKLLKENKIPTKLYQELEK